MIPRWSCANTCAVREGAALTKLTRAEGGEVTFARLRFLLNSDGSGKAARQLRSERTKQTPTQLNDSQPHPASSAAPAVPISIGLSQSPSTSCLKPCPVRFETHENEAPRYAVKASPKHCPIHAGSGSGIQEGFTNTAVSAAH